MASVLTIDNYTVSVHERWARDQEAFEQTYIRESGEIPAHLDIATLEKPLLSKWEELFELDAQRHSFAHFAPPPKYMIMRNRFFTHAISEEFDWAEGGKDQEQQGEEEEKEAEEHKEKIRKVKRGSMPLALFEKERSHLMTLIDSIQLLNSFMQEIHARKLQYQKG